MSTTVRGLWGSMLTTVMALLTTARATAASTTIQPLHTIWFEESPDVASAAWFLSLGRYRMFLLLSKLSALNGNAGYACRYAAHGNSRHIRGAGYANSKFHWKLYEQEYYSVVRPDSNYF